MQWRNTAITYGWISILFHWVMAVGLIALFVLGWWMVDLDYYSEWYHQAPWIHKSIGVLMIVAMLLRWAWNRFNTRPQGLDKPFLNTVAHAVHGLLYGLVLCIGISGYLISTAESEPISVFGWFEIPALIEPFENQADWAGLVHEWLAYGFMALVGLHALAALKHHFMNQDNTLKRMLRVISS